MSSDTLNKSTKDCVWVSMTGHSAVTMCQTLGFLYGCSLGPAEPKQIQRLLVPPSWWDWNSPKHLFRVGMQGEKRAFKKDVWAWFPRDKDRNREDSKVSTTQMDPEGED